MNVVSTQDNERMFNILTELMHQDKEFQIVIKVPSQKSSEIVMAQTPVQEKQKPVRDLEKDVTDMIHELGVPAHIKGYQYLREAIMMSVEDVEMLGSITKILYPTIAKRFQTTPSRVERAIRHAINAAWINNYDEEFMKTIFQNCIRPNKKVPSNSVFLSRLYYYIINNYQ